MGDDLARVASEDGQQVELDLSELHLLATLSDGSAGQIDRDIASTHDRIRLPIAPGLGGVAEGDADASQEFAYADSKRERNRYPNAVGAIADEMSRQLEKWA